MTLLAEKLPEYDRELVSSVFVAQPPPVVFKAIHEVRLREMPLAVFLHRLRYVFAKRKGASLDRTLIETEERGGWVSLGEVPDREVTVGVVGRFWKKDGAVDRIDKEQFSSEAAPDRVKVAVDYWLEPVEGGTRLTMSTRIKTPRDEEAARNFRRYYYAIRIGIPLVAGSGLRAIKRRAERARA
jgi:hypothetical protein